MKFYREQLANLEAEMQELEYQPLLIFSKAEKAIETCRELLQVLRRNVLEMGFKDQEKECFFFKEIKPKVVGYMIHFINLIYIERERLYGNGKEETEFLKEQVLLLRNYFYEHREFYEYYIRERSDRDKEFFLRKTASLKLHYDSLPSMMDNHFSTTHDMLLAKIIGNLKTIDYLQKRLFLFQEKASPPIQSGKQASIKWTGSKVDLVELVYALHTSGSLNNGRADLKEIAQVFENILQIQLGDYYRTFLEIRGRKIQTTKFLDHLKSNLERRMVEADG